MITVYSPERGAAPQIPEDLTDDVATAVKVMMQWEQQYRARIPCGHMNGIAMTMRLAIDITAWQMHLHQVYLEIPEIFTPELAALTAQDIVNVVRLQPPDEPMVGYHFGAALLTEGVDVHEPVETLTAARDAIAAGKGCYTRDVMAVLADGTKINVRYHEGQDVVTLVLAEPEELTPDPYDDLVVELNELYAQLHPDDPAGSDTEDVGAGGSGAGDTGGACDAVADLRGTGP